MLWGFLLRVFSSTFVPHRANVKICQTAQRNILFKSKIFIKGQEACMKVIKEIY